jgi:hypothetical protein
MVCINSGIGSEIKNEFRATPTGRRGAQNQESGMFADVDEVVTLAQENVWSDKQKKSG